MFRKEEALARDWTPEKSQELSQIQKQLCLNAADMLQPGGQMLYSTCTFAPAEDEEVISWLLEQRRTSPSFPWKTTKAFPAEIQPGKRQPGVKKMCAYFPT